MINIYVYIYLVYNIYIYIYIPGMCMSVYSSKNSLHLNIRSVRVKYYNGHSVHKFRATEW